MTYVVLVLALALACVAGVQLFYIMFLQTVSHHDRRRMEEFEKRLRETERELETTSHELEIAEEQLAAALKAEKDNWPEIIDG
jgi:TolA-binding protein